VASLIAFANFSPSIAESPFPATKPETVVVERIITIPELIREKSARVGVDGNLATAIAFCESTNQQFSDEEAGVVMRGKENPLDVGLFQINEKFHLEKSQKLGYDIYTLEGNIDYALWLLKNEGSYHWKWSQGCWQKKM